MSDSVTKHEDKLQDELEWVRDQFAGATRVYCASDRTLYDLTKVGREDIVKGMDEGIFKTHKAINVIEGLNGTCFLKWDFKYAEMPSPYIPERTEEETQQWVRDSFAIEKVVNDFSDTQISTEGGDVVMRVRGEEVKRISLTETPTEFETFVTDYCNDLRDLLIEKNKSYGNSAIEPIRIFSTSDSEEQIRVRIDDKLSRVKSGSTTYDEDTIQDLQGYLILLQYKNKTK